MRKEFKSFTTKKSTEHNTKIQQMKEKTSHIENTLQNEKSNFLLISNYFQCKCIKLSYQKTETGRMDFFKELQLCACENLFQRHSDRGKQRGRERGRKGEKRRREEGEKEKRSFHLLVLFPNSNNNTG